MKITPLMERAFLIIDDLAFEVIDNPIFGGKYLLVTDCENETYRAQFIVTRNAVKEKTSAFADPIRRADLDDAVTINKEFILREFFG